MFGGKKNYYNIRSAIAVTKRSACASLHYIFSRYKDCSTQSPSVVLPRKSVVPFFFLSKKILFRRNIISEYRQHGFSDVNVCPRSICVNHLCGTAKPSKRVRVCTVFRVYRFDDGGLKFTAKEGLGEFIVTRTNGYGGSHSARLLTIILLNSDKTGGASQHTFVLCVVYAVSLWFVTIFFPPLSTR